MATLSQIKSAGNDGAWRVVGSADNAWTGIDVTFVNGDPVFDIDPADGARVEIRLAPFFGKQTGNQGVADTTPSVSGLQPLRVAPGQQVTITPNYGGTNRIYSLTGANWLSIDPSGRITGTAPTDLAADSYTVRVTNAAGAATATASIIPESASASYLPATTTGVVFGDSRLSAQRSRTDLEGVDSELVAGSGVRERHLLARGIENWLQVLSYGQFSFPTDLNFAEPGDSISEQLPVIDANLTDAISNGAGFVLWLAGRNGVSAGDDGPQLVADAQAAIARFRAQDIPIVVIVDWPDMAPAGTPGATFTSTQAQWDAMLELRNYYLSLDSDPWISVIDAWSIMGPTGAAPALPSTAQQQFFEDEWLHQAAPGAFEIARAVLPVLSDWSSSVPALPAPSIVLPPLGTTGGNTAGGTSGDVPAGWISAGSNLTGLSVTGSAATLTVDGTPTEAHRSVVTGTAGNGALVRFLEYQGASTLTEATTLQVYADFEVTLMEGATSFFMALQNGFGGSFSLWTLGPFAADGTPDGPFAGRFISPPVTMPSGFKPAIRFAAGLQSGAVVNVDARFGNIRLVEVGT